MSQNKRNTNPVGFVTDERQLSKNREAAFGEVRPHIVPLGYIPPFQIVRTPTQSNMSSIDLTRLSDGTVFSIASEMVLTGFVVNDMVTYKIWIYPGTAPIGITLEEGTYSMTITDTAGDVLYREDFCWMQESAMIGFVKMEWFHQRPILLSFGSIEFVAPFKFWHWFRTELGKPSYQYQREVDERNGFEFVIKAISWKEQRFVTLGDENFVDALSFIPHMDCVFVYFLGDTIDTDKVLVTPEWEERGDLAGIEVEIRSDQVVATFGDALAAKDYELLPDECIPIGFTAEATIFEGGAGWTGGFYRPAGGGANVNLVVGQYVILIQTVGQRHQLNVYGGPGIFLPMALADDVIVYEQNEGDYLVQDPSYYLLPPTITNIVVTPGAHILTGIGFPGATHEIYGKNGMVESLLAVGTNAELAAGITFDEGLNTSFQIRVSTWQCSDIAESVWVDPDCPGIGVGIIETDFKVG